MERVLGKFAPHFYVLLRLIAGLLFACHGAQKLFGLFGGVGAPPAPPYRCFPYLERPD
jgi:putative oxidoreductase